MKYTILIAVAAFLLGAAAVPRFVKADSGLTVHVSEGILPGYNYSTAQVRGRQVAGFSCIETPNGKQVTQCYVLTID